MMDDMQVQEPKKSRFLLWKRLKQTSLPEQTWFFELQREVNMERKARRRWLKRLSSSNEHIRQAAQRDFGALPPNARRLLTANAYYDAVTRVTNTATVLLILGLIGVCFAGNIGGADMFSFAVVLAAIVIGVAASAVHTGPAQELAKNLLDGSCDPRLVPFLAVRLRHAQNGNYAPRKMLAGRNMRNALVRLLPYVEENDAAEWTGTHWKNLLYFLRYPYHDVELTRAVIGAMARIGNEEALRDIKALASLGDSIADKIKLGEERAALTANKDLIRQTAQEYIPCLEARVVQQRQSQTLLRASGAVPTTVQDILLRPAQAFISETPAEQLLRPGNPE